MGNGKVMTVWEDHLIPFDWIPVFDDKEMKKIVEQRTPEMRSQFTLAMKFALNYTLERKFRIQKIYLRSEHISQSNGMKETIIQLMRKRLKRQK